MCGYDFTYTGKKFATLQMCCYSRHCSVTPCAPPPQLCALYAVTDVALVTSLRDGMNLVSYEYVACQSANAGRHQRHVCPSYVQIPCSDGALLLQLPLPPAGEGMMFQEFPLVWVDGIRFMLFDPFIS